MIVAGHSPAVRRCGESRRAGAYRCQGGGLLLPAVPGIDLSTQKD